MRIVISSLQLYQNRDLFFYGACPVKSLLGSAPPATASHWRTAQGTAMESIRTCFCERLRLFFLEKQEDYHLIPMNKPRFFINPFCKKFACIPAFFIIAVISSTSKSPISWRSTMCFIS